MHPPLLTVCTLVRLYRLSAWRIFTTSMYDTWSWCPHWESTTRKRPLSQGQISRTLTVPSASSFQYGGTPVYPWTEMVGLAYTPALGPTSSSQCLFKQCGKLDHRLDYLAIPPHRVQGQRWWLRWYGHLMIFQFLTIV